MTPGKLDIEVPRNGSDSRILHLVATNDAGEEETIDLTGHSVSAQARDVPGGAVIATATTSIDDAAGGRIAITWLGSDFDAHGDTSGLAVASWDLKLVDPDGQPSVPLRGTLYITAESTA